MTHIRIAIATATPHEKTETFIAAHIERLKEVVLVLTGGSLPEADGKGDPLLGSSKWAVLLFQFKHYILRQDRATQLRRRIIKRLREQRVELVLAEYGVTAMGILPCCQELGIPLVTYFLGFDAYDQDVLKRMGHYQRLFAMTSGSIVVSHAMERQLLALGSPADRTVVIPCGVDLDRFKATDPSLADPTFLAAGRFVHSKAPNLLLSAFKRVMDARPHAKLIMVGDGPLWESCHHFAKAEGMLGNVELVGRVDHAELARLMATSRAFVQHSISALTGDAEGMPVAVIEAMSTGLPVIATRHMGIAESVIHGGTGLLCEEHDVETMARHMIAVVDDPALAGRMGAAGRKRAQELYGMDKSIGHVQEFLEKAAHRAKFTSRS